MIPEMMQWKRFPNQYLVSTEGQRKLATQWKPQWNDPVGTDLLPAHANGASELQLMTGPQPEDFVDNERYCTYYVGTSIQCVPYMYYTCTYIIIHVALNKPYL